MRIRDREAHLLGEGTLDRMDLEDGDREDIGQTGDLGQSDRRDGIEVTRADRVGQRPQFGQVEAGQPVTDPTG
ncbi:hypothetical protein AB0B13_21555 [Streptomyces sp. NPDC042898]|uniref:hypothetical protein n=1 Tax=Streptomyces sp. NPDC042898 TaxID=3154334 RepID=UPI0033F6A2BD